MFEFRRSKKADADKKLREQALIIDHVSDAIITFDKDSKIISWSKPAERLYGWTEEEMLGKNAGEILHSVILNSDKEEIFHRLNERQEVTTEAIHYTKSNEKLFVEAHTVPFIGEDGEIKGYITVNRDITKRKEAEEKIRSSEETLGFALDVSKIGLWEMDLNDRKVRRTLQHAKIFGYESAEQEWSFNLFISHIVPEERDEKKEIVSKAIEEKTNYNFECRIIRTDGELRTLKVAGQYFAGMDGKSNKIIGVAEDITDRVRSIDAIKEALKEKEVLLRELYHRTKNNMQVIYSLLGLRSETIKDYNVRSILDDMRNRIMTISLVHQKLYQSKNLSKIDLKDYIYDLTILLMESYSGIRERIKLKLEMESIAVLIDTAVPLGMVINELITNSIKHAFPNNSHGEISVKLSMKGNTIELQISDNGIGIPDGIDIMNMNTLGAQLLNGIVENQLGGTLELSTKGGVTCTIRFSEVLYVERV